MIKRSIFFCVCIIFFAFITGAQDRQADSLKNVLLNAKEDSSKVNALIELSKKFVSSSPIIAIHYANQAKELALKINYLRGDALGLKYVGNAYYTQGKYLEAIKTWQQAIAVFDSIGDKGRVANMQSNIGAVYFDQGDDEQALLFYFMAL